MALMETEGALRARAEEVENRLSSAREKLTQLLAVASQSRSIPLPGGETRGEWLDKVWEETSNADGASALVFYLAGELTKADLRFLLGEVLDNLTKNLPIDRAPMINQNKGDSEDPGVPSD